MLLTVDIGNTNTVLGVFEDDELVDSWRIRTEPRATHARERDARPAKCHRR